MSLPQNTIDDIVARVVEQFSNGSAAPVCSTPPANARATVSKPKPASTGVVISDGLVTEQLLESKVNGAKRIQFGEKTVLTPSARDYLNQNGIMWSRGNATECSETKAASSMKAIVLDSTSVVDSALAELGTWSRETVSDRDEAAKAVVSGLWRGDATGVVVFAKCAEFIACRLNRTERIRAAAVHDATRLKGVVEHLDPNVICIDPTVGGFLDLRRMLRTFAN